MPETKNSELAVEGGKEVPWILSSQVEEAESHCEVAEVIVGIAVVKVKP